MKPTKNWSNIIKTALNITTMLNHREATAALTRNIRQDQVKLYFQPKQAKLSFFEDAVFIQNWALANALLDMAKRFGLIKSLPRIFNSRQRKSRSILARATYGLGCSSQQKDLICRLIKIGANCKAGETLSHIVKYILEREPNIPTSKVDAAVSACKSARRVLTIVKKARRETERRDELD
jgi:hypothetical protein